MSDKLRENINEPRNTNKCKCLYRSQKVLLNGLTSTKMVWITEVELWANVHGDRIVYAVADFVSAYAQRHLLLFRFASNSPPKEELTHQATFLGARIHNESLCRCTSSPRYDLPPHHITRVSTWGKLWSNAPPPSSKPRKCFCLRDWFSINATQTEFVPDPDYLVSTDFTYRTSHCVFRGTECPSLNLFWHRPLRPRNLVLVHVSLAAFANINSSD